MAETYEFVSGELVLRKDSPGRTTYAKHAAKKAMRAIIRIFILMFACIVTWWVFRLYIATPSLDNTVSFGAVFATLGTSIVSVLSLTCGEQYSQFGDNIKILQEQLLSSNVWERWPFVKRIYKRRIQRGLTEYQILKNPYIRFIGPSWETIVFLPSSKVDFYELPVFKTYFALKKSRPLYRQLLSLHADVETTKDILVWDCLTDIYRNIIVYRAGHLLIWLGGCFVFTSILFSFFYSTISGIA